jgi:hypothetical protein
MSPTGAMRVSALLPFDWLGGRALVNNSPRCNASMVPLARTAAATERLHAVELPRVGAVDRFAGAADPLRCQPSQR